MFNPDAKLNNCNTCGDITEQIIKCGKVIKKCTTCRELNNNKKNKNKNNGLPIQYEATPPEGFYKRDNFLYLDNIKEQEEEQDSTTTSEEQEETEEQQKQRRQKEHEQKFKKARDEQEAEYKRILKEKEEQQEAEQQQEQPKEKTIKDLLNEINLKLDKTPTANNSNNNIQEEITTILNNLFKQMDETHEYIILSHRERKQDHEQTNEFIKQQELNNTIIINKLDRIINAVT